MRDLGPYRDAYDAPIYGAAQKHKLDGWDVASTAALIKAHIAQESNPPFNWRSLRQEKNNASVGLMQVLLSSAPDLTMEELFDPVTNIDRGAKIIYNNWRSSGGDLDAAISAYNGGWNRKAAMGYRADVPLTVCLARDTQGNCVKTRHVAVGEFGNQPYVDSVEEYFMYFLAHPIKGAEGPAVPAQAPDQLPTSGLPPVPSLRGGNIQPATPSDFPAIAVAGGGGLILLLAALAYYMVGRR